VDAKDNNHEEEDEVGQEETNESIERDASSELLVPDETGTDDTQFSDSDTSDILMNRKSKDQHSSSCDTAIRVQPQPKSLANVTVVVDSGAERDELEKSNVTEPSDMTEQPVANLNEKEEVVMMEEELSNMTCDDVRKIYLIKKVQMVDVEVYVKRLEALKLEKELGLQLSSFTADFYQ